MIASLPPLAFVMTLALGVTPVSPELGQRVKLLVVADKLDQPLAMAYVPGDPAKRLFIAEKTGGG